MGLLRCRIYLRFACFDSIPIHCFCLNRESFFQFGPSIGSQFQFVLFLNRVWVAHTYTKFIRVYHPPLDTIACYILMRLWPCVFIQSICPQNNLLFHRQALFLCQDLYIYALDIHMLLWHDLKGILLGTLDFCWIVDHLKGSKSEKQFNCLIAILLQ